MNIIYLPKLQEEVLKVKEYRTNCINSIEKFKELNRKYENKWIKLINQL
jgi:hypothetical protein